MSHTLDRPRTHARCSIRREILSGDRPASPNTCSFTESRVDGETPQVGSAAKLPAILENHLDLFKTTSTLELPREGVNFLTK